MSASPPSGNPRKRLPVQPSVENLKKQAKRRAKLDGIELARAQHLLAVEYGSRNWAELMHVVEVMRRGSDQLADVKREVEPLPKAVRARDVATVRRILSDGTFTQHDLDAGLAHAAWYGGDVPDVLAVRKELFDLLLDHGADPDGQYGSAYGPIVFGTGECLDPDGLQWLIDAGCDVTFGRLETKYGPTCPLDTWLGTCVRGQPEKKRRGIDILLRHNAFIPPDVTPPILAIHRGDVAEVDRLLRARPELLTPELWPPAIFQAQSLELTRLLLDRGLDPNLCSAPRKPLHLAADRGLIEIVRLLLDRGARLDVIDGEKLTPYDLLCCGLARPDNVREIRQILRDAGAVDTVFTRIYLGQDEAALALLKANPALATTRGPLDFTPLQTAARAARPVVVRALLDQNIPADDIAGSRNSPLWLVCQSGVDAQRRIEVATMLLDAGANPRRHCEKQSTPLHIAAWRGPIGMVELLLRRNAKEWMADTAGRLPRDYAAGGEGEDRDAIVHLLTRPVITDAAFKAAVAAIHAGDLPALDKLLTDHPNLAIERAKEPECYPPSYFSDPKLLWFVANNPNLIETMPPNMVHIAKAIIEAGAERADIDYTLELVMTSDSARKQGLQKPLMDLLLARGGTVQPRAIEMALAHSDIEPVQCLLDRGQPITAPLAAGLGRVHELQQLLPTASTADVHAGLSLAVINGHTGAVRLCLDAGADVNAFCIVHVHATPAHLAVSHDDLSTLKLLVERGANLAARDTLWNGTPLGWAVHEKKLKAADYLRTLAAPT